MHVQVIASHVLFTLMTKVEVKSGSSNKVVDRTSSIRKQKRDILGIEFCFDRGRRRKGGREEEREGKSGGEGRGRTPKIPEYSYIHVGAAAAFSQQHQSTRLTHEVAIYKTGLTSLLNHEEGSHT